MTRIFQVIKYGWKHSKEYLESHSDNYNRFLRLIIWCDMLSAYIKFSMWTNQYMKENYYFTSTINRKNIRIKLASINKSRDSWLKDFRHNRKFIARYSSKKYEIFKYRNKRNKAYSKEFNAGENLMVEYDVEISRQHFLNGKIKIGKNVLLAKHSFIDISGNVTINDNVQITKGASIFTHHHAFHSNYKEPRNKISASPLIIEEGAVIGCNAIILSSCNYIGKHARVGAGAVVGYSGQRHPGIPAITTHFFGHGQYPVLRSAQS